MTSRPMTRELCGFCTFGYTERGPCTSCAATGFQLTPEEWADEGWSKKERTTDDPRRA
jgi:hypothetical protein